LFVVVADDSGTIIFNGRHYLCERKESGMAKMFRLVIALIVLASGCMLGPLGVNFTAELNGIPFKAIAGSWEENVSSGIIFATDIDFNTFTILLPGVIEEKEYSFGPAGQEMFSTSAVYLDISEGKTYMSQSGTLTITSKTDRLVGEFEMTMAGLDEGGGEITLEVTNGLFDLPSAPDPGM
jgi:hypothetical protein